jgi:starch synthase
VRILLASAEAVPYFKTGGLGDVARALPDALTKLGHDVAIIHPRYRRMGGVRGDDVEVVASGSIPWPGGPAHVQYLAHRPEEGAPAVLVEQPAFFDVAHPYDATHGGDPLETGRRFAFYCRAIVHYAKIWNADVIHLNDWPTGLVPYYGMIDGLDAATVFAIHNLAYQGNYPSRLLDQVGIPGTFFRTENGLEFHGAASFMKGAVAVADQLVTVSPTYAQEIQTPQYGAGLDGLLRFRRRSLHGILNGIDPDVWNPATDRALACTYDARDLAPKDENREALLRECGLDGDGPLFVMVTRLAYQKGVDIALAALPALLDAGIRIAVLGDGEAIYERALAQTAAAVPGRVAAFLRFDDGLARRMYAGGDFFLMPSRYEPCGLGQMIAQRYGTPPVARHTGGLVDTVEEGKTGFLFDDASPGALVDAARRAANAWRDRGWTSLRRRCMRLDRAWTRSAERYVGLYEAAIGTIPG